MSTAKAISGNNIKNNGTNMLHAGSVTSPTTGTVDFGLTSMDVIRQPFVSGLNSKAVSDGEFSVDNRLMAMGYSTSVAGEAVSVLVGGAGIQQRKSIAINQGYNRYDLESFDILTGLPTYGDDRGARVLPSGADGEVGPGVDKAANPSYAVPGALVYRLDHESEAKDYTPWTG